MLSTMSTGMLRTIGIFALTRFVVVRAIVSAYISIIRGTPLMLQLLVWYFGPFYLFKMNIADWRFPALIIGFVVNYAAYFAEIYRGGIEAIPIGQFEAADVLGYTRVQTFMRIILPQVIKRIMPAITNEVRPVSRQITAGITSQ